MDALPGTGKRTACRYIREAGGWHDGTTWRITRETFEKWLRESGAIKSHGRSIEFRAKVPALLADRLVERSHGDICYFVKGGELIKIGFSSEFEHRFKNIQSMCPVPLEAVATFRGGRTLEHLLHEAFWKYRSHGEWFRVEGRLRMVLEELKETA